MKQRPYGFLSEEKIDHNSEPFKYIQELHEYLWGFIRTFIPSANGNLENFVDSAITKSYEYETIIAERNEAVQACVNAAAYLVAVHNKIQPEMTDEQVVEMLDKAVVKTLRLP